MPELSGFDYEILRNNQPPENIRSIQEILQSLDDSEGRIDAPPISRAEVRYYFCYARFGKRCLQVLRDNASLNI